MTENDVTFTFCLQIQEDKILIRVHYKEGSYQTFQVDGRYNYFRKRSVF